VYWCSGNWVSGARENQGLEWELESEKEEGTGRGKVHILVHFDLILELGNSWVLGVSVVVCRASS
jgi:hypothetical protein